MVRTGRPREFDEQVVVDRAMELFWERGYASTSIQDLVDVVGVQRGSLYQAFGDKRALLLRALARYRVAVAQALGDLEGDGPVVPVLRRVLVTPLRPAELGRGCLLGNTAVETSAEDTAVIQLVRDAFAAAEDALRRALERAYDSGELPRRDAAAQARMLLSVQQGLQVMSRTRPDPEWLAEAVDAALDVLH